MPITMTRVTFAALAITTIAACHGATSGVPDPEPVRSASVVTAGHVGVDPGHAGDGTPLVARDGDALAAFGAGCFWGVEDAFRHVPGVVATAVGYSGGHTEHPTYEDVCTHRTGHAETVLVEYDPNKVTYETLLRVFFENHDPTTPNRQGPDIGSNYRSVVFTFSTEQESLAKTIMQREQASHDRPIVTEIVPMHRFWKAEDYHQQYDEKTGTHSCPMPKGLPSGTGT